ncbi:MAG: BadF/BadG/BcrA/BcrD ATPase family protein [Anaerolineae bacterium]
MALNVRATLPPLYLGIDGGGSGLRLVLADADLSIYGRAEGPGANPSLVGRPRATAILQDAMRSALGDVPQGAVAAVGIGVAGAAASHSRAWLLEVVHAVLPDARVVPSADYEIALVGVHGRRLGVIVLAGTGALAYGVNAAGETALAGGWGYLLGDEGGGYWMGREGLQAVLRADDTRGPKTSLSATLLPALGLPTARDTIPWLYHVGTPRTAEIAALAPLVLEAAAGGDECALDIVARGAQELALAAGAVKGRLGYIDAPIAFAGGLLTQPNPLSTALCARLGLDALPRALYPPVMGAVLLARDACRDGTHTSQATTGDRP